MTCQTCNGDGGRFLIAGLEQFRHYRPSDHKFVPAPSRSGEHQASPTPLTGVRRPPAKLLASSEERSR